MDAVQQQQANRIAQLKEKIALAARQLNKLREDNERDAFKIQHMDKHCELLHEDLRHLAESRGTFEGIFLDTQILRNIGKPMNYDMLTSTEFNRKLAELRVVASRLLVCTAFNEDGAHKQMAMDELHFSERLADGLEARRLLTEEIRSTRKTIEQNQLATLEQKIISVDARICLQKLENEKKKHNDNTRNRHICGAEGNRLNRLNKKQKQKKRKRKNSGVIATEERIVPEEAKEVKTVSSQERQGNANGQADCEVHMQAQVRKIKILYQI
ncbi:hypothetical protein WR25_13610 [Diploscapter pachys]|uniref:Uncharacterized protein n=1 Tax=Diploscapter pachys TaxID=2018661 RepID=A0A2A2LSI2_9BILA|nr:hypothetical protein WR25_13610 [Diploscapter pachys]